MAIRNIEVGLGSKPFRGLTELPYYGRDPGWMRVCQNFRVMPDGYLEARGGFDAIKPSGGTASDPISAGIFTGAHEHSMADGYIFTAGTGGTVFSANLAQRGYFEIFSSSAEAQHDAIYIGSTIGKFSRVVFYIGQAMVAGAGSLAYEYPKSAAWDTDGNAATSGTFTLTTTPDFTATGEQTLEVVEPGSAWVRAVRNGVYAYWIRIRLTNATPAITTACRQGPTSTTDANAHKVFADWPGVRQIYVSSANSTSGAGNGTLKYYGQTSGTAASWNSVSTSLWSGNFPRTRFASYKNVLYFVNGKEEKRWDGHTLADIGFTAPDIDTDAATAVAGAGTALGNGVWLYAMTYGYGPLGEWGESGYTNIGTAATTVSGANDGVRLEWNFTSGPPAAAECIYLYRTQNLSSAQSSGQAAFPYYRIATLYRSATGSLPSGTGGSGPYTDETLALPFPPVDLNIATLDPPTRCSFITTHKNRLFLGSNNQYPGRVWWSETFQAESFNQDENFADFTRSTGGRLMGMAEFNDQVVVFTEDQMFGIANVDQDIPSIYVIHNGVGCIAPDSIAISGGVMCWLGRNGAYMWDGNEMPKRVSDGMSITFPKLSYETHGDSRAVIHNRMYEVRFCNPRAGSEFLSTILGYRYDLVTDSWATTLTASGKYWLPLTVVTAPPGHANAGKRHPLWGQGVSGGSDFGIYLGEYTTQDAAANYVCKAQFNFSPDGLAEYTMHRMYANFDENGGVGVSAGGWGTPTLNNSGSGAIGDDPGTLNNMAVDAGSTRSRITGLFTDGTLGTGDLNVDFTVTTDGTGEANGQRLLSVGVEVGVVGQGPVGKS